jgi:hypothetical protein
LECPQALLEGPAITGYTGASSPGDAGKRLVNIIMIDDELMIIGNWTTYLGRLRIQGLFRGCFDTKQAAHAASAPVYFLASETQRDLTSQKAPIGINVLNKIYPETDHIDVKIIPTNTVAELAEASATEHELQFDKRARRPYIFGAYFLNNIMFNHPSSQSLEAFNPAGKPDLFGFIFSVRRRDYDLPGGDELAHMVADADTLQYQFSEKNNHYTKLEVWKDHATTPVKLFTLSLKGFSQHTFLVYRNYVLRYNAGVIPGTIRLVAYTQHDDDGETLTSREKWTLDMNCTSAYSSLINGGAKAKLAVSNIITVASATVHNFTIQTALAYNLQWRLNGGAWQTAIAAGSTTGATATLAVSDTIEIRHQEVAANFLQTVEVDDGTATVAYVCLYT